jgi:maltooligosyltrehalose trehalohydrolase
LRLDATQDIHDASPVHVLSDIVRAARAAAPHRRVFIVGENEPQESILVRDPAEGGYGLDALWNDDFHHSARVALTRRREAYYLDYLGSAQELVSCAKYGFLYQGQYYTWQKKTRGTPAFDLPSTAFVAYLENHDQVANSAFGRRLHQLTSPGRFRAMTALLLLGPATPMLFQGQEFNSTSPFLYFADHVEGLREPIETGRREFLQQFPSVGDPALGARRPRAMTRASFERSKLEPKQRQAREEPLALHRDLITLRRSDPVVAAKGIRVDGAVLRPDAFVLRYFGAAGDRLLVVNLGPDMDYAPAPEPLLAPPGREGWTLMWSSEDPRYGGQGTPPIHPEREWHIPGDCAVLFGAARRPLR